MNQQTKRNAVPCLGRSRIPGAFDVGALVAIWFFLGGFLFPLAAEEGADGAKLRVLMPHSEARLEINEETVEGAGLNREASVDRAGEPGKVKVEAIWESNSYTESRRFREVLVKPGEEITVNLSEPDPDRPDHLEVIYVPTRQEVVDAMCRMAGVGPDDVVFDLGCGDGRIVIAAVERFDAKKGVGVDINPDLVELSKENARKAGVGEKMDFRVGNVLEIDDLSSASVVMLYMGDAINLRLRPILQKTLPLGARIVSHDYAMGDWKPVRHEKLADDDWVSEIFLWVIDEEARRLADEELESLDRVSPD